ncbi:hypothetical protein AQUCO_09100061v1 [Aquilegia coerulea]|uniref:Protein kinase domain-containing protein n=1 Tax=Aquilegia coerulea TaxID=218851 RepID=A0A2G5C5U5_AQUCA|nr:hypothetical protein AQUCO_09100061v1 [Aquilegia coerulea]
MTKPRSFLTNLILKPFKSLTTKDNQNEDDLEKIAAQEQKQFLYEALFSATKGFHPDNKLGQGGFGPVFKGKLEDGREVAVKQLSQSSNQGKREFMNEAKLLARVQHRNVVNLLGYCIHGTEKLLVYEYLPHQSLDKFLFNNRKREELDWKKRHGVIVGVARGLLYLHEDSHISIIHRDIKASNILLDERWAPKIADFGMARLFPEDQTVNTRIAGTNGYMAPEYSMHGQLSIKADVYSFGVVMLELISGQKNSTFNLDKDARNLLEWAWKLYKKERSLEMMDVVMAAEEDTEQVAICIKIGLLCVQADPKLRPTMRRVVVMLTKKSSNLEEPTKPGYPGYRYRRVSRPACSSSTAGSGESSQRPAISGSMTDSSGKSSQNFDSTSSSTTTSTNTRFNPYGVHGTSSPLHTIRRTSHSQDKHNTVSSTISDPSAERSSGKRPIQEP